MGGYVISIDMQSRSRRTKTKTKQKYLFHLDAIDGSQIQGLVHP
jgi:hypothetical protein